MYAAAFAEITTADAAAELDALVAARVTARWRTCKRSYEGDREDIAQTAAMGVVEWLREGGAATDADAAIAAVDRAISVELRRDRRLNRHEIESGEGDAANRQREPETEYQSRLRDALRHSLNSYLGSLGLNAREREIVWAVVTADVTPEEVVRHSKGHRTADEVAAMVARALDRRNTTTVVSEQLQDAAAKFSRLTNGDMPYALRTPESLT